jgi:arsenate reductase
MNILFLCVGNSARSQIAEGLANNMFGNNHVIRSAGSCPTGKVHGHALIALEDIGIDISSYKSKAIEDLDKDFIKNLDFVITLCADEVCPVLPSNAKLLHWVNEDPVNDNLNDVQLKIAFSKTRDNIFNLLKKFMIDNNL